MNIVFILQQKAGLVNRIVKENNAEIENRSTDASIAEKIIK